MWRIQILISSSRAGRLINPRAAPQPSICANWDIVEIFPIRTHQTWDNLNKQQRHFQEHARSADRDVIWNLEFEHLSILFSPLRRFVASPLTLNYDHAHTAAADEANCRTEPCCGDMHARHRNCKLPDAPKARSSRGCSPSSTDRSSGDGGWGSALAGRNYCSRMMRESFELTLDSLLQGKDFLISVCIKFFFFK